MKKQEYSRYVFWGLTALSFAAVWFYNTLTPYMSDDLLFERELYRSLGDIIRQEYHQYMTWNGRSVLQIILKIFSLTPKWVFNLCNSACFVGLALLIYVNIRGRKKYDGFLYLLINLLLWNFSVEPDQTLFWLGGACNYLWGMTIIMGMITAYRFCLDRAAQIKNATLPSVLLFLLGILAGWGNENTSGGAILILLCFTGMYFYKYKKIRPWMISGLAGMCIGFLFLLLAPGNRVRGAIMASGETYSGLGAYISRGLKVLRAIDTHMMVYLVALCLLGAYFYYRKDKLDKFYDVIIYGLAGLATSVVLVLTSEPMPRAYFGANIFFMIACVQMIQFIPREERLLMALKTGGILAGTVWMFFSYVENGANLVRILREVNEREAYIMEQTSQGNRDLTLPMLRPQFTTKYSYMYENDISDEEGYWMNEVFRRRYGLDSLTVVPREGYEEY